MKYVRNITLALLLAAATPQLTAKNIYASPTGNGTGTEQSPCSLTAALKSLASSDSLFLMGGTYMPDEGITIRTAGTAQRLTYIGAYNGERPVLDFRNIPHGKNGVTLKADYIHIKGIAICYAGYKGLINEGSYCIMEQLDAYGNCDTGIQQKKGKGNLILNCDSHENFDYETGSIDNADWGGNADGFADKQYTNSPGNTYIGCRSWNNSDDGWDFYQRVGGTTVIQDCICYAQGPEEYDLTNHPRRQTDRNFLDQFDGDGITITLKNSDTKVKCSLKHFYNNGNANGFKLGGGFTKHDVTLLRCLAVGNNMKGFDQNNNQGMMRIYNATAYLNEKDYGFFKQDGYTLDIANSISLGSKQHNQFDGTKITSRNNTWLKGFAVSDADFASLDTTLVIQPRLADGSLPVTDLLRLKQGSSLIDAGIKLDGIEYCGSAPDLGCYESDFTSGISQSALGEEDSPVAVYRIDGTRSNGKEARRGFNIIRYKSGKVVKRAVM